MPPRELAAEVVRDTLPPDSTRILAQARRAQRGFEAFHRSHLPRVPEPRGGSCDERIGRICLHYDGGDAWESKEEDLSVTEARERLLDTLEVKGDELSGDRWILG